MARGDDTSKAASRRPSLNSVHEFHPVGMDLFDPKVKHPAGTPVRIIKAPGVGRPPKTFEYVEHAETGEFLGMVLGASLRPRTK